MGRPPAPLGVGPRRIAVGVTVPVRALAGVPPCARADTKAPGVVPAIATLAGVRLTELDERPRVPKDVPPSVGTPCRVAETSGAPPTPLVPQLLGRPTRAETAVLGAPREAGPAPRVTASASVALTRPWPLARRKKPRRRGLVVRVGRACKGLDGRRASIGVVTP